MVRKCDDRSQKGKMHCDQGLGHLALGSCRHWRVSLGKMGIRFSGVTRLARRPDHRVNLLHYKLSAAPFGSLANLFPGGQRGDCSISEEVALPP